jgi:plastocyanin
MRRPLAAAALLAVALLVSACAAAQPPAWTYAPPTPSPTAGPSASAPASAGASGPASAAPSAQGSAGSSAGPSDGGSSAGPSDGGSAAPSGGSAAPSGGSAAPSGGSAAPSGGSAAPSGGSAGGSATTLDLIGLNFTFDKNALSAPVNAPFTIHFDNQDPGVQHNVAIKDGSGNDVTRPALLTGPGTADYSIPALSAGTYTFYCILHPTQMTGTLTVGP